MESTKENLDNYRLTLEIESTKLLGLIADYENSTPIDEHADDLISVYDVARKICNQKHLPFISDLKLKEIRARLKDQTYEINADHDLNSLYWIYNNRIERVQDYLKTNNMPYRQSDPLYEEEFDTDIQHAKHLEEKVLSFCKSYNLLIQIKTSLTTYLEYLRNEISSFIAELPEIKSPRMEAFSKMFQNDVNELDRALIDIEKIQLDLNVIDYNEMATKIGRAHV